MSKEIKESLTEIALQLQEQLKFYREIGLTDIGASSVATESAPVADFKPSPKLMQPSASDPARHLATSLPANLAVSEADAENHAGTGQDTKTEEKSTVSTTPSSAFSASEPLRDSSTAQEVTVNAAMPEAVEPTQSSLVKPQANEKAIPTQSAKLPQAALFGDFTSDPGRQSSRSSLPVLSALPVDPSLEAIRAELGDCTRCKLHEQRTKIVFGEGNPHAKLMFVGEGPGADEDLSGRPFVGKAGQLLDKIIAAIGYQRQDVYIGNIVKCRPPQNRTPEGDEVEMCEPFLFRQIAFIKPQVIVALGSPAFQCLFRTKEAISKARGEFREWNGIQVMPTFHPAYLLRSPDKKREVWEDMKIVRAYLNTMAD